MHVYLKFTEATQLSTAESVCCGPPTATMDTPATLWKCPTSQPPTAEARQRWEHFSASRSMFGYTKGLKTFFAVLQDCMWSVHRLEIGHM